MKKYTLLKILWLSVLGLLAPLNSYGYCPDSDKVGWNFSDALIYWGGFEQGLGYTNKPADVLTTDDFTQNSVINPTFKWEWGFRMGIGYTQCDHQWTYKAAWTHLESKAHGRTSYNSGPPDFLGIYPIWSMSPDTLASDYVSTASANWHLHTDIADFIFQYNYGCFCDRLMVMPFVGIRGVLLSQKLTAKYEGGTFFSGIDENTLRSRYYSGGPRFGLNADYYLACGFSIFGRGAVAPLFGTFHNTQHETYLSNTRYEHSNTNNPVVLSTDYEIGLRWRGLIIENWPYILLSVAWEGQEFFFANKFNRGQFNFFSKNRALYLQGVTFNAALDF